jgi:hypothetical protein
MAGVEPQFSSILASQVARITGVNHWCLAIYLFLSQRLLARHQWLTSIFLATWWWRLGGSWCASRPAWAKLLRDPILTNKKLGMVMYVCHPSYVGSVNRRIGVQAGLRHSSKNT